MKRIVWLVCALLAFIGLAGCVPERVVWSPDGTRAAVLGDDGLHLCDADGKLGAMLVPKVSAVQWMPDGKGLVVVQEEEHRAAPEEHAAATETRPAADTKDATRETVRIYRLSGDQATAGPVLKYLDPSGIHDLRISPDGRAVAITWTDKDGNRGNLSVVATDGSNHELAIGPAAIYPDWSPDGKFLVYIHPINVPENGKSDVALGALSRRQVWDASGTLLDAEHAPAAQDLAGLIFDTNLRLRVAKDGRIFFVSAEVSLPVTAADFEPKPQLFCLDPARQATVVRVVPRSAVGKIGDLPQFFELSPDAAHASVPFKDGRVSVIDLATGDVAMVQDKGIGNGDDLKLTSVPTWRSANDLTFVRPAKDGQEVARYSLADKSVVVMSKDWPDAVGKDWLSRQGATTTSQP